MQFRIKARTVIQLGAELISSDAIAFYELIKNAFDARSPRVTIHVRVRAPHKKLLALRARISSVKSVTLPPLREDFLQLLDDAAPDVAEIAESARKARTPDELLAIVDETNSIEISDRGDGMSREHLESVYLELGTPFRLQQREAGKSQRVLGEKGLGRLSAMRLGWRQTVRTTRLADKDWHVLDIDWQTFARNPESYIEDIEIPKPRSEPKTEPSRKGTIITIRNLLRDWTPERLERIAADDFSRLTDPFTGGSQYPITLKFNGKILPVPSFSEKVFSIAHAVVDARFEVEPRCRFVGHIDYKLHKRDLSFDLGEPELLSVTDGDLGTLRALGAFSVRFYWYNRQLLTATDGIGDRKKVLDTVRDWANGLMVFRDGFRVNPYGGPDDDWLDLDEKALGSGGFKVNRHQIIGKIDISADANRCLLDQTNREGLRHNDEYYALVKLLQHLLWSHFKALLDAVAKELVPDVTLDELSPRVQEHRKDIRAAVTRLTERYPSIKRETELLDSIDGALRQIGSIMKQAQQLADQYERRRGELIHLAGLGLMVEILAHELSRSTQHALSVLSDLDDVELPQRGTAMVTTLKAQLSTLNTRLKVLDPLATTSRQRKERFDLVSLLRDVLESRASEFGRHSIITTLRSPQGAKPPPFIVVMVKGMVVQILENLLSNSVYWLKQAQRLEPQHKCRIDVVVDSVSRSVSVTDNGPGVAPTLTERIFEPFFSTKPPGLGKGLGLYISREIATYHNADLRLSPQHDVHPDRMNTFVLSLPPA